MYNPPWTLRFDCAAWLHAALRDLAYVWSQPLGDAPALVQEAAWSVYQDSQLIGVPRWRGELAAR